MRLQTGRFCDTCRRPTLHAREVFSTGWGLLLTVLTCGLFLLLWIPLAALGMFTHPWRCQSCGDARFPWGGVLMLWAVAGVIFLLGLVASLGGFPADFRPFMPG